MLNLHASEFSHSCVLVCESVSDCLYQSPCIGHHIFMLSNYSAACITLSMWHTISRQLTWASECQPIGCAIKPLNDISIITLLPICHPEAPGCSDNNTVCVMHQSVSFHIYIYVVWCHTWFLFCLWVSAFLQAFCKPFVYHCQLFLSCFILFFLALHIPPSLCFWLSLHPISACHLNFMPICPLFASHLWVCSSGSKACLALKQYDARAEKTSTDTSYCLCI